MKAANTDVATFEDHASRPTTGTHHRPLLATFFVLTALGIPAIFLVIAGAASGSLSSTAYVPAVTLVAASMRIAWIIYGGLIQVLSTTLWMFVYITAAVVPLAQTHTGVFSTLVAEQYLIPATWIFLVAVLAYEVGRFLGRAVELSPTPEYARVISHTRLRWLSIFALAGTAYYVQSIGGIAAFFSSRAELREALNATGLSSDSSQVGAALATSLGTVPIFLAAVLWWNYLQRNHVRSVSSWVWFLVLLGANLISNNPWANPRYWVLTIIVAAFFATPGLSTRLFHGVIIGGLLSALVLFPYSDYLFRYDSEGRGALVVRPFLETIATKDFDQVTMTANGVWWVDQSGHTFGNQILGALFFWVPRSVWPDKARDTGVEIGTAMGVSNVNLSSPLPLEFWVDFGWVGLVAGFVVLGYLSRRGDWLFASTRDRSRSTTLMVDILVPVLAGYTFILMRGPLLQSMGRLSVIALVLILLLGPRIRLADMSRLPGTQRIR